MDTKFKSLYINKYEPRQFSTQTIGSSRTQTQFAAECDVNNILKKYRNTGMLNHVMKTQGNYGDFSSVDDYQTTLHKLTTAQDNFLALPSELRSKFNNDPANLISFINDPKNYDDSVKYGLIIPRPKTEPTIQEHMEKALEANDTKRKASKS